MEKGAVSLIRSIFFMSNDLQSIFKNTTVFVINCDKQRLLTAYFLGYRRPDF